MTTNIIIVIICAVVLIVGIVVLLAAFGQIMTEIITLRADVEFIKEDIMRKSSKDIAEYLFENKEILKGLLLGKGKKITSEDINER